MKHRSNEGYRWLNSKKVEVASPIKLKYICHTHNVISVELAENKSP